jgi:subfamily B ATP-binding cassette protein HlyB/CyaB
LPNDRGLNPHGWVSFLKTKKNGRINCPLLGGHKLKLLQGFYQPTEGAINLDGHDIRHLSANELRSSFSVVPPETTLFSGAVYDNIVLGNAHATFDDVVFACKAASIHDMIEALPQGYQTTIGEHGAGLSGGQKQRSLLRALLKRPPILT